MTKREFVQQLLDVHEQMEEARQLEDLAKQQRAAAQETLNNLRHAVLSLEEELPLVGQFVVRKGADTLLVEYDLEEPVWPMLSIDRISAVYLNGGDRNEQ